MRPIDHEGGLRSRSLSLTIPDHLLPHSSDVMVGLAAHLHALDPDTAVPAPDGRSSVRAAHVLDKGSDAFLWPVRHHLSEQCTYSVGTD